MKREQIIPSFFLITVLSLSTLYACGQSANKSAETNPSATVSSTPAPTLESIKEKIERCKKSIDNANINIADVKKNFQDLYREYTTYSKEQLFLDVANKNYVKIQYIDEKIIKLLNQDFALFKTIDDVNVNNDKQIQNQEKNNKIKNILITVNNNLDYLPKLLTALEQARKQGEDATTPPQNNSSDITLFIFANLVTIFILVLGGYGCLIVYNKFRNSDSRQPDGQGKRLHWGDIFQQHINELKSHFEQKINELSKLEDANPKIETLLQKFDDISIKISELCTYIHKESISNSEHKYSYDPNILKSVDSGLKTLTSEIVKINNHSIPKMQSKLEDKINNLYTFDHSTQNVPILNTVEISDLLRQQTTLLLEQIKNSLVPTNTTASYYQESYKFEDLNNKIQPLNTSMAQILSMLEDTINNNNFHTSDQSTQDSPLLNTEITNLLSQQTTILLEQIKTIIIETNTIANQSEALNDQRLNELRKSIESLKQEKKDLESKIQQLEKDKSEVSLQIKQAQDQIQNLQNEKIDLQNQIAQKGEDIKKITNEKDKLSQQIKQSKKEEKTAGNLKPLTNNPEVIRLVEEYNSATNIDVFPQHGKKIAEVGEELDSWKNRISVQDMIVKNLPEGENLYFIIKLENSDNYLLFPKNKSISPAAHKYICGEKISPFKYEGSPGQRFDLIIPATVWPINPSKGEWQLREQGQLKFKG
ncbi:hypothetical protein [Trichormus variabilis]|uniref:DUF4384 domain-containing protein n=1 Tax=Trichormus variabilis SAG 1403-4b TaxID=447716 RepID=A0A3S1ATB1_ANAVA|nr:hypothetical protein [Trichormus variabilis]MBD2625584.1 hypothetical protein [Trichormus variabilis FACHB-164]RUS98866.1 hypothetical protein DSM107003_08850 [Trichormus variabilis SAG 1403-4b]